MSKLDRNRIAWNFVFKIQKKNKQILLRGNVTFFLQFCLVILILTIITFCFSASGGLFRIQVFWISYKIIRISISNCCKNIIDLFKKYLMYYFLFAVTSCVGPCPLPRLSPRPKLPYGIRTSILSNNINTPNTIHSLPLTLLTYEFIWCSFYLNSIQL